MSYYDILILSFSRENIATNPHKKCLKNKNIKAAIFLYPQLFFLNKENMSQNTLCWLLLYQWLHFYFYCSTAFFKANSSSRRSSSRILSKSGNYHENKLRRAIFCMNVCE